MPLGETPQFQARVQRHLPLVRLMVNRFKRRLPPGLKAEDLYRVGVVGPARAAGHGRADHGGGFRVYASARIRGAILDELRRLDCLSRPRRAKAKRLARAIARPEQGRDGEVGREALRMELQREEAELQALVDEARPVRTVSLDAPGAQGVVDTRSLQERRADERSLSPSEAVERNERIALLAERIAALPELPRKVLAMHSCEHLRLDDLAACFGLPEAHVGQIRSQTRKRLRTQMAARLA